jgi:hypothetical protein
MGDVYEGSSLGAAAGACTLLYEQTVVCLLSPLPPITTSFFLLLAFWFCLFVYCSAGRLRVVLLLDLATARKSILAATDSNTC